MPSEIAQVARPIGRSTVARPVGRKRSDVCEHADADGPNPERGTAHEPGRPSREGTTAETGYPSPVADDELQPKERPGPFYVLNGHISCASAARSALARDARRRRVLLPPSAGRRIGDVDDAIRAMWVSCIEVYRLRRDRSDDPVGGSQNSVKRIYVTIRHEGHPVVLRNRVRFVSPTTAGVDQRRAPRSHVVRGGADERCLHVAR